MAFFNVTLISGIQDLTALLPLLGTEQVEQHIGSALNGGFLYAAASPMSLFGSLGAVKIAFTILIATYHHFRGPSESSQIGARWLANAGFSAPGDVAYLIGTPLGSYLSGRFETANRSAYIAEDKLMSLIDQSNVDSVAKLEIKVKPGLLRWNLCLFFSSLVFALLGIAPYIYFFHHFIPQHGDPPPWVYPTMRAMGTMTVAVLSQYIIQLRLLQILRSRLIFLSLAEIDDDVYERLNMTADDAKKKPAEELIQQLKQLLSNPPPDKDMTLGTVLVSTLQTNLSDQERKRYIYPFTTEFLIILGIIVVIGGLSTVVGYIGSFTVVQSSNTTSGPLTWLVVEGSLSLVRILIWGSNPRSDDHAGLDFISKTSQNIPLVLYGTSEGVIEDEKELPLTASKSFLRTTASYIGPIQPFTWPGVSVYYTLTWTGYASNFPHRILYVTVFHGHEPTSSVIIKIENPADTESWTYFKIRTIEWDIPSLHMGAEIDPSYNVFTRDAAFLRQLQNHCSDIFVRWNRHNGNEYTLTTNWSLILQSQQAELGHDNLGTLTPSEIEYVEYGKTAIEERAFFQYSSWWNRSEVITTRDELSQERPLPRPDGDPFFAGDKLKINEIEHLLLIDYFIVEHAWARQVQKNEDDLFKKRECMVQREMGYLSKAWTPNETGILKARLDNKALERGENRFKIAEMASRSRFLQAKTSATTRLESDEYRYAYTRDVLTQWPSPSVWYDKIWGPDTADDDLEKLFMTRFSNALERALKLTNGIEADSQDISTLAAAQRWCGERWKAMMHRRWTVRVHARDLEKAKTKVFRKIEGQDKDKAQESIGFMVRVMRSKYTRFFDISDALIEQIRSRLNTSNMEALDVLLGLILYNEVTTVIAVSTRLARKSTTEQRIAKVVSCMPNVAHYGGPEARSAPRLAPLSLERVLERLSKGLPVITYNDIFISDRHRPGNPYLLFGHPGKPFCDVGFQITSQGLTKKVALLSHCGTSVLSGKPTKIRITVKKHENRTGTYDKPADLFNHVYSKGLGQVPFNQQWVQIDNLEEGRYNLKIELEESSGGCYWLDYVELADFDKSYHWRVQYPELRSD